MKGIVVVLVLVSILCAVPAEAGRVGRVLTRATIGLALGAAGGAAANTRDREEAAREGAIAGAVVGAGSEILKPGKPRDNGLRANPHNQRIGPPQATRSYLERPKVLLRNCDGADPDALTPVITSGLHKSGYSVSDGERESYDTADYYLDVVVRQTKTAEEISKDSVGSILGEIFGWGVSADQYSVTGGGVYRVAITMVDAGAKVVVPEQSVIQEITVIEYSSGGQSFGVVVYHGVRYETEILVDPATEAAIWASEFTFTAPEAGK